MKKVIRAASNADPKISTTEKVNNFISFLVKEGMSYQAILEDGFLYALSSQECLDILKKVADLYDVDYSDLD